MIGESFFYEESGILSSKLNIRERLKNNEQLADHLHPGPI
jgi:hypothetical protein